MLLCGVGGLLLFGGTMAYLTDYEEATNQFTVGKVEISLEEPDWKPEKVTKITPGQEIKKNPKVTNTGVNDAFVYLSVSIPKKTVVTADAKGNRLPAANQELFTYTVNEGWEEINCVESENAKVSTYAFHKILSPKEATGPLFDTVTFLNVVEGQLDTQTLEIPIKAYAIQTANTDDGEKEFLDQAKAAYTRYVNQNQGEDGQVQK